MLIPSTKSVEDEAGAKPIDSSKQDMLTEKTKQSFLCALENHWGVEIPQRKTNPTISDIELEKFKNIYEPAQNLVNHLLEIGVYAFMDRSKKLPRDSLNSEEKDSFIKLHALTSLSPHSDREKHAPKYHEFGPLKHTQMILYNRMQHKDQWYAQLQGQFATDNTKDFEETVLGKDLLDMLNDLGFLFHDIAKEMPYYSREDCGFKATHRGHELMGAYLINPDTYRDEVKKDKVYSEAYEAEDWLILERAARSIHKGLTELGYSEEQIKQLGYIIELHFHMSDIRNKLFHQHLYEHSTYINSPDKVAKVIEGGVQDLIKQYHQKQERYKGLLSLEQYLHLIGITYVWDNVSKIQFMPNIEKALDKEFVWKKRFEINKKAKEMLEGGASEKELNELIHGPFGHFAFEGFLYAKSLNESSTDLINKLIDKNMEQTGNDQAEKFIMKNSYGKFLHKEHLQAYVDSINSMYLTLWIYQDYLKHIAGITKDKQ